MTEKLRPDGKRKTLRPAGPVTISRSAFKGLQQSAKLLNQLLRKEQNAKLRARLLDAAQWTEIVCGDIEDGLRTPYAQEIAPFKVHGDPDKRLESRFTESNAQELTHVSYS